VKDLKLTRMAVGGVVRVSGTILPHLESDSSSLASPMVQRNWIETGINDGIRKV